MKNKVVQGILVVSLICAWGSVGSAGQIGYNMRGSEAGFGFTPNPNPPSSAVMAFDALIGRPLGLATTIVGVGILIPSIPLTLKSDTTAEAAWGLVGRPGGWTFIRPLGRGAPVYEERGVFQPEVAPASASEP
jgi:hypothetical protein